MSIIFFNKLCDSNHAVSTCCFPCPARIVFLVGPEESSEQEFAPLVHSLERTHIMTSVSVKLSNGSVRYFNTNYVEQDKVQAEAIASGLLRNTTPHQQNQLLDLLRGIYLGTKEDTFNTSEALTAAGVESVTVGKPAPVAAPVLEDDDDDEVPAVEDLPVYNATVEAQERPARFAGSTPAQFKVPATVSRVAALVLAGAALVAGVVAGGVIF
jgi:hypothetical protein